MITTEARLALLREANDLPGVLAKYAATAATAIKVTPEHVDQEWERLAKLVRVAKARRARR